MKEHKIWASLDPFVEGGEIMGRGVANAGFLRALLTADPFDAYHFFLATQGQVDALTRYLQTKHASLYAQQEKFLLTTRQALPQAISDREYYCFHLSDCINFPAHLARVRNARSSVLFPITSLTHSLSYFRYTKEFLAHLWPGTTRRDVVVATSRSGQKVVLGYYDFLRRGYGLPEDAYPQPEVVRVPLGIDTGTFARPTTGEKNAVRKKLGIAPEETLLILFGRIAHDSKYDVLPVLRALQRVLQNKKSGPIGLFLAGAGAPAHEETSQLVSVLQGLAKNLGVRMRVVFNPTEPEKLDIFAAGDVFVSPVDNLQETFGITLLEAGAMGLPVIASDYDGYRDLVDHEKTGLLVPTVTAEDTSGHDCLASILYDNQTHLTLAQQTVVDVPALAKAIGELVLNVEVRERMGNAARERVLSKYDWGTVVEQYVGLWDRLWQTPAYRNSEEQARVRTAKHPLHVPYGEVFGSYPTRVLDNAQQLCWSRTGQAVYRGQDFLLVYGGMEHLIDEEVVRKLLFLARKKLRFGELVEKCRERENLPMEVTRTHVLWALKHDLLECV